MRSRVIKQGALLALLAFQIVASQPEDSFPTILGEIENVANSASNLLSGLMQRPKELIHRMTDTASGYISSAVEKPRNLLLNATRVTTGYINSAASKGLEFKLRRFLEKFRSRMPFGLPELGIPPLEPLHLDGMDLEINNQDIGNVSVAVDNMNLYNLSAFVINKAKLSLNGPTITMNISVPRIYTEGFYNISGLLGFALPLNDAGPLEANISDFQLYLNAVLGYSGGVYLKAFDLDFFLKSIEANLENFIRDLELRGIISKVFEELTGKALDIIKPDILPGIQSYIGSKINDTIHHLNMGDIISILIGRDEIRQLAHQLIP